MRRLSILAAACALACLGGASAPAPSAIAPPALAQAAAPQAPVPPAAPAAPVHPGIIPPAPAYVVDDFSDVSRWTAHPADGTELAIRSDRGAMRLDFRFLKGGGYVIARRDLDLALPDNFAFSFRIRGEAPPEHLEFKLVDSTGTNVWWSVRRDVEWPEEWQTFRIKKRQISFAWGPAGGGEIRRPAALEIAITAGSGGAGAVWMDDLTLTPLPPPDAVPPAPVSSASSERAGSEAAFAADGDSATAWSPREPDRGDWLALDFQTPREFGGLTLLWAEGRHASNYDVETSDDGRNWTLLRRVGGGNGGRDHLYLPESEARHLRVRLGAMAGDVALAEIDVRPLEWSSSRAAFFEAIAKEAPRGTYPRSFAGEQIYWTVAGVDGDTEEALVSEDGAVEVARGGFSIEPFLFVDGKLLTWADATAQQSLAEGFAPVPRVILTAGGLDFGVDAFGTGEPGASSLALRYFVWSRGGGPARGTLYLAIRPFQVNPPAQFLNMPGGTSPIRSIARDGSTIHVNGRRVIGLQEPAAFGAVAFDGGEIVGDFLRAGRVPPASRVDDPFGAASAALAYPFELEGRAPFIVDLVVPFHDGSPVPALGANETPRDWSDLRLRAAISDWKDATGAVTIEAPKNLANLLRSQVAYVLVNRAGPAIQPGTRSYARSWIRDGALTSSGLLRLGRPEPVREFIEWFAPYQYANGKIPCVVDARGSDPVPEHDSSGEFIFVIAEYYRYTRDRAFVESLWPRVAAAAAYLDSLRQTRRTDEYRTPEKRHFFGLLPESISHEGYSAKPMHSYWDDFFAARGFRDAEFIARELGRDADAARLAAWRGEFERDLRASIEAAMAVHGIDYIPGCADLGDFDATSTAIAVSPLGLEDMLPGDALARTFDKYMEFFRARRDGAPWEAYTPYETRIIGTLVRLGRRAEALELLDYFLLHQRPKGWNHWAEVVWNDVRLPRFIGDMPHTWVGTEFARSVLDMLAYEDGSTLVIAAGLPPEWASEGVRVSGLPTSRGPLAYTFGGTAERVTVTIDDGVVSAGGIRVRTPFDARGGRVTVNGVEAPLDPDGSLRIAELPAEVVFEGGSD